MRTIPCAVRGALLSCALALIASCGNQPLKPDLPPRTQPLVTQTEVLRIPQFHYLPLPQEVTQRSVLPSYPDRPLANSDLTDHIGTLEAIVGTQNCQLASAECLGNAVQDSPEAQACIAALESCTGKQ